MIKITKLKITTTVTEPYSDALDWQKLIVESLDYFINQNKTEVPYIDEDMIEDLENFDNSDEEEATFNWHIDQGTEDAYIEITLKKD